MHGARNDNLRFWLFVYRAKEARWRKLQEKKSCYEAGTWNVNAVMMGGLGGDPETSSSEEGQ